MYLYCENRAILINMDSVAYIYAGANGECVRIVTDGGAALKAGVYDDADQCDAAIKLIAGNIRNAAGGTGHVLAMPTKEQAQAAATRPEYHHHAGNGKKPVRRGGS